MPRLLLIFAFVTSALAAPATGLPPLIDREILFGNPEIASARISPDGKYIAFLKPWNDTRNIWVKKTAEPFASAKRLTDETKRPVGAFGWSRDGKFVLYVKDNGGDENFNLYAVDPAAETAVSRDLTGLKGVVVQMYKTPKSDPDTVYIGLNDRDKAWHDLYKLSLSTGQRTLMRKNTEHISGWIFDEQGKLRLATRTTDAGDQDILRVDADAFTKVYSCGVLESCGPVQFHKDGKRLYMVTNKGAGSDLISLTLLDPETGKAEVVESDPMKRVDLENALFSEATGDLIETIYVDEKTRRYFHDKKFETDYHWLETKLPRREIGVVSGTADDQQLIISASGDTEPGETYLFDRTKHTLVLQYRVRERVPREALSPMKTVRYPSYDGLEISAYLTLPKGLPEKALPLVVVPHGGPWARDTWGYNSLAQFLANRGYAVLMPNFRGSTGYGKKFLNAGNGEWGRKMQDDITWGVKYLEAQGIADPKRIAIMGGSYGGYATLAGVAYTPELYRAAVDIVGPSNLTTLLEAIPPYWESARKIMYTRMADVTTAEGAAWMKERSPLYSADKITTPLLVVQGANDPRVNKREAEQIVIALRDRGRKVEYMLAPDEGHGFQRPVNNMAMFMAAERFLAAQLDGRYQKDGTPEVTARLKEITVDPATVTVSKIATADSAVAVVPVTDLVPGTYNFQITIAMGGQQMAMTSKTVIREAAGAWSVVDTMDSPMGAMADTGVIEKKTLVLRHRSATQGPLAIELDSANGKGTGSMSMNGQSTPISLDLGGDLFADGPGSQFVIAALPLKPDYTATFRNFDAQKQKVKLMQLKVAGSESVTVPAGTFDCYKVEITPGDGSPGKYTVWVAKNPAKPVKVSALLPQMGGATMTMELAK